MKREVNIAFDNHFEVTLGVIVAPKGAAGATKYVLEAAKCSQGDCQGRLGLEKACSRGPKDVQEEPTGSLVRLSGFKMTSNETPQRHNFEVCWNCENRALACAGAQL